MFSVAINIQILIIILCFVCILLLAGTKNNSYTHLMLLAFVCAFIQNVGYYFELTSSDVASGFRAIELEYMGGAFIVSLITIFMFKYCNYDIPNKIRWTIVGFGIFVLYGLVTWESNHMFYTSLEYDGESDFPHFVVGHGWLFVVFMAVTICELLLCLFVVILALLRSKEKHMRYNYMVLLGVIAIPLSGFLLSILGFLKGYDATPPTTGLGVIIFGLAISRKRVFDIADIASENLIEDMNDAVIVVNNDMGYEKANKKAKELYPELLIMNRATSVKDTVIGPLFDFQRETEIVINSCTYDVHITPVTMNGRQIGYSAVLFDVTDNKKQLEKMRELMEAADEANLAKSTFLANVSHEIRTPINVVLGMSEVLLRDHRLPEIEEYVVNIKQSADTLLSLINDVLDFSKIEAGKMSIINNEYDMKKLLQEISEVYKFRCEKRGLHFDVLVPKDLPRYVIGDEVRVRQILNNILSNSIKYTEKGSVCLKVSGKYRSDYDIDFLFTIEDTGIGVKPEDQDKLFHGFTRVNLKKTNTIQGTGLGLKITKQLVELMRGAINFRSVYDEGTVFTIVLPQKVSEIKTEKMERLFDKVDRVDVYEADFVAPSANILVVDDTKTNLMVVKELLKKTKVNITTSTSGEECLELVKENHYDLIFLDHRMPGMDGIETYEQMQKIEHRCTNTPVVMLTANAIGDARDFYLSKNFADFLSKPVTSKQLIEMLIKYLPGEKISRI